MVGLIGIPVGLLSPTWYFILDSGPGNILSVILWRMVFFLSKYTFLKEIFLFSFLSGEMCSAPILNDQPWGCVLCVYSLYKVLLCCTFSCTVWCFCCVFIEPEPGARVNTEHRWLYNVHLCTVSYVPGFVPMVDNWCTIHMDTLCTVQGNCVQIVLITVCMIIHWRT